MAPAAVDLWDLGLLQPCSAGSLPRITRLLVISIVAVALLVPLVLIADCNVYVLTVGCALILAAMAAADADRFLDGKRRNTRLR